MLEPLLGRLAALCNTFKNKQKPSQSEVADANDTEIKKRAYLGGKKTGLRHAHLGVNHNRT